MSGRRLREAVKKVSTDIYANIRQLVTWLYAELLTHVVVYQELTSVGTFRNSEVVIAGLSNVYTHYITTYEEYQVFV